MKKIHRILIIASASLVVLLSLLFALGKAMPSLERNHHELGNLMLTFRDSHNMGFYLVDHEARDMTAPVELSQSQRICNYIGASLGEEPQPIIINERSGVNGLFLEDIEVKEDWQTGAYYLLFTFNEEGSRHFYQFTQKNAHRSVAVVFHDLYLFSARIAEPISGGEVKLSGYSLEEIEDFTRILEEILLY